VFDYNDRFIVTASPTVGGPFEGHANEFATWLAGDVWEFSVPLPGWACYVLEKGIYYYYTGTGWIEFQGSGGGISGVVDGGNLEWM
jgi:hypothetical protein